MNISVTSKFALMMTLLFTGCKKAFGDGDFEIVYWNNEFIYSEHHALLLVIDHQSRTCYFNSVDGPAKKIFSTCNNSLWMAEVYDRISFGDISGKSTTLSEMRHRYSDVLTHNRCHDYNTVTQDLTFAEHFMQIHNCQSNGPIAG